MRHCLRLLVLTVILSQLGTIVPLSAAGLPDHPLIEKAKKARGPRVSEAIQAGARVELTSDGKSFYLLWLPEGTTMNDPPPMVVTMHGHGSWAFEDFHVWRRFLEKRGYGLLAIQWWLGEGEKTGDYLRPDEMYRTFDDVLRGMHIKPGSALLHGFSRGAANIYPVAVLDRDTKNDYFGLFIANAGKANSNYPPVGEIERGRFGEKPLAGTHWVTYAGAKDTNPDRDGVQGMRDAGKWVERYGGTVELAIEDPNGDHGGFHRNSSNTEAALDVFEKLRTR